MKKCLLIFGIFIIFGFLSQLHANDSITLDNQENLSVPTSQKIGDWYIDYASASNKTVIIKYYWADATGQPIIMDNGKVWQNWDCRDISRGNNADCLNNDDPWLCCDGPGAGTCPEVVDDCFTQTFLRAVQCPADDGVLLGVGLRTLLFNQWKQDSLTPGNDGSFD